MMESQQTPSPQDTQTAAPAWTADALESFLDQRHQLAEEQRRSEEEARRRLLRQRLLLTVGIVLVVAIAVVSFLFLRLG